VAVANGLSADEIAGKMHLLGEVTGLALRKAFSCPMEIDLMPPDLVSKKKMKSRIPFFIAASAALIITLACWWGYCWRLRVTGENNRAMIEAKLGTLRSTQSQIDGVVSLETNVEANMSRITSLLNLRVRWIEIVRDIQSCLLDGMWITSILPVPRRS